MLTDLRHENAEKPLTRAAPCAGLARVRSRPFRLAWYFACSTVLAAGCDLCNGGFPDLADLQIESIEIVPSGTYAEASAVFELYARARDVDGHIVPLPASSVEWSGGVDFDPERGNPTLVKTPDVSDVTAFINGVHEVTVVATVGDRQSEPAKIWVVDPNVSSGDRLHIHHVDESKPTSVLLDGKTQSAEVEDLVVNLALRAKLQEQFLGGGQPEVGVFSPERAMHFEHTAVWTDDAEDELEHINDLNPLEIIPVSLRIAVADASAKQTAIQELAIASDIFRSYRVGVEFQEVVEFELATDISLGYPFDEIVHGVGGGEDLVVDGECTKLHGQYGIDLDLKKLNVVYVHDIAISAKGVTCPQAGRAGRLILMPWQGRAPTTLAHELGHVMSLVEPHVPFGGHTGDCFPMDTISGFEPTNLMWACLDFDRASRREHISLGQAFRMNMDAASWIHQVLNRSEGMSCQCNPYTNKPCPRMSTDVNPLDDEGVGDPCNP